MKKNELMLMSDLFAVTCDFCEWDEENDCEKWVPVLVHIDYPPMNIITFNQEPKSNLRLFSSEKEAKDWCKKHDDGCSINTRNYKPIKFIDVIK